MDRTYLATMCQMQRLFRVERYGWWSRSKEF